MTITYQDSKRISGLSTDTKPTGIVSLTGCKAYYNFEQTTGSLINQALTGSGFTDGLGSAADATVTGSPTRTTTGKLGSYATTNIDGCAFTIPNSTTNFGFLSDQSYSLAFWVKKASSGATVIIGSSDGGGGWYGYTLMLSPSSGELSAFRGSSNMAGYGEQWHVSSAITDSNWHHVVVTGTSTGGNVAVYVDNVSKTVVYDYLGTLGTAHNQQSDLTFFGYGSSFLAANQESTHTLDEFSIWNRVLTQAEVTTLYNLGGGRSLSNQASPETNNIAVETDTGSRGFFDGNNWNMNSLTATGGTITTDGNYKVHTFTTSGTFTVSSISGLNAVQLLVIAGGGGGGTDNTSRGAGGGGAGGYRTTIFPVTATSYTVTVGGGGALQTDGSNSSFSTFTSSGGGQGANGNYTTAPTTGGSGGGGSNGSGGVAGNKGGYSPVEGYFGGTASTAFGGAGGGGAGYAGDNVASASNNGSKGGDGLSSSITGSSVTRAGGGGGGMYTGTVGSGGAGGGGAGGVAGTANTGGGGGGGSRGGTQGQAGGSGIVIVRYRFQ